jgi:hypothetical protein
VSKHPLTTDLTFRVCTSPETSLHLSTNSSLPSLAFLVTMSTVKPPLAGQDPSKTPPIVGAHNLDTLQGMLNMIFITSGRFIKEHQSGGGIGRMKIALQKNVPIATERFHDALDELENEVRLAQTVLRRDLALMKQDRKRRELAVKEKEAEKARLAAESMSMRSADKEVKVEKVSTPIPPPAPIAQVSEKAAESPQALERKEEKVLPPPIETATVPPTERDPLFDGTPTTADPKDDGFDFEAIFGDDDAMDTSGDHTNNDAGDMMDTSGDLGFNFDEGPSLLRGLEDFANARSSDDDITAQNATATDLDMAMPDLPDLSTDAKAPIEPSAPIKAPEPPIAPPVTETANDTAAVEESNTDDMMGDMMTNDLDDLFNMDEYENPEQSLFDDAFFNYE